MAETKQQSPQAEALQLEGNELTALLKKEFKPKSDEAKGAVERRCVRSPSRHWRRPIHQ